MITQYINKAGETVIISEMPDAYLLNALAKYKNNIEEIEKKLKDNPILASSVAIHLQELVNIREALRGEVSKRNLL